MSSLENVGNEACQVLAFANTYVSKNGMEYIIIDLIFYERHSILLSFSLYVSF